MSRLRKFISISVGLALSVGLVGAVIYRSDIIDQFRVWQYQPSSEIASLADRASMSDSGKYYFYIAHPKLEAADEFNQECRRAEPASALLGCYKSGTETIHIYDVDDSSLDGVEEVTATHEMLHVAYARLSQSEREELSPLLESAYSKVEDDKLAERMDYYERAQPGSRENELHSILATEYADIGDELEDYYKKYFIDRNKVVELYNSYNQQFEYNESQADQLATKLEAQRAQIDAAVRQYESDMASLNQDIESFNQRAKSGEFTSQSEFASQRTALQSRSDQLSATRVSLMSQIDAYNSDVEKLNALGREIERLNNSLDSMKAVE